MDALLPRLIYMAAWGLLMALVCHAMAANSENSHFKRVVGYARTSDYVAGGAAAAFAPGALYALEKFAPSYVGKGGFAKAMRLAGVVGVAGGFLYFYQRSCRTFPITISPYMEGKRETYLKKANTGYQFDSTAPPKTLARSRWICGKWCPRSRPASPCMAKAD